MPNKHVFLKNKKNLQSGFNRKRGFKPKEQAEEIVEPTIKQFQVANLRNNYTAFTQSYESRYTNRSIEFPAYIDLIEIRFFPIFSKDLKNKFFQKYGVLPVSYSDFNRTVVFEVVNENSFDVFKADVEFIISLDEDVPYSGEEHNLIATIYRFRFINKRTKTNENEGIILSAIQSVSIDVANLQKERLKRFLGNANLPFSTNDNEDLFYLNQVTNDTIISIEQNFDIIQSITSSRALNVRPGMLGSLRMEYGFSVEIPENLPIIGIIDTGINRIEPFNNLIVDGGINITGETDADHSGHGSLVAGLAIFGQELPSSAENSYVAKCKVLPIKVLHNDNDGINFPLMLKAIRTANRENGVRLFSMSLVFYPKKYNEAFSEFAYELDRLSHELGVLIFISVGNFDSESLRELLTTDFHNDHTYPDFYYKLNATSPVHNCENTNISTPSESLNNLSIGALAGNMADGDNSDITPANIYPAYYTRKFHFDYEQKVNATDFAQNQKNKHLNKPDLVFDGGDLSNPQSGIEVLASPAGNYFLRTAGTSLSAPLITSMAAEIEGMYPELDAQSIKALLINCASYYNPSQLPHFQNKGELLRKLIGFGVPERNQLLLSDNNSITLVVEDQIKPLEVVSIPIFLPEYLKTAQNKLIFDVSITYSSFPDKGNHLSYLPLHMSFNLVKNVEIAAFHETSDAYSIKSSITWSEDHHGLENRLFSNAQRKEYRLQPNDIVCLDGEIAMALRCLSKDNIGEGLKNHLENNQHAFSLVIRITEELRNTTEHNLYNEMHAINNLTIISEASAGADLDLEN
jgi:hypothetical protein